MAKEQPTQDVGQIFGALNAVRAGSSAAAAAERILAPSAAEQVQDEIFQVTSYGDALGVGSAKRIESWAETVVDGTRKGVEVGLRSGSAVAAALSLVPKVGLRAIEAIPQLATHIPAEALVGLAALGKLSLGAVAFQAIAAIAGLEQGIALINNVAEAFAGQEGRLAQSHAAVVATETRRQELAVDYMNRLATDLEGSQPEEARTRAILSIVNPTINNLVTKEALQARLQKELSTMQTSDGSISQRKKLARLVLAYFSDRFIDPETTQQEKVSMVREAAVLNAQHVGKRIGIDFPYRTRVFNGLTIAAIEQFNEALTAYKARPNDARFAGKDMQGLRDELGKIRQIVHDLNERHLFFFKDVHKWSKVKPVAKQLEALILKYADILPSQARMIDMVQVAENLQVPDWFGRILNHAEREAVADQQSILLYTNFSNDIASLEIQPDQKDAVDKNKILRRAALNLTSGGPRWARKGRRESELVEDFGVYEALQTITGGPVTPDAIGRSFGDTLRRLGEHLLKGRFGALVAELKSAGVDTAIGVRMIFNERILKTPNVLQRAFNTTTVLGKDGGQAVLQTTKNFINGVEHVFTTNILKQIWNDVIPGVLGILAKVVAPDIFDPIKEIINNLDLPDIIELPPIVQ